MSYIKKDWKNNEMELSAENFNYMQDGIYDNQNVEIISLSDEAPSQATDGDKYYNTNNNKIHTYGTSGWDDGETPIRGCLYILIEEQVTYYYNGTTLVSVGGGTEDIYIQEEEPEDGKIWIDTSYVDGLGTEVVNSLSGNETSKAPSVSAVKNALQKGSCSISTYSGADQATSGKTVKELDGSTSTITTKGGKLLVIASCNCFNTGAGYFFNIGIHIGDVMNSVVGSNQSGSNTLTGMKIIDLEAGTYNVSLYVVGTDNSSAIKVPAYSGYSYSVIEL